MHRIIRNDEKREEDKVATTNEWVVSEIQLLGSSDGIW